MEEKIAEMQKIIDELSQWKQDYNSHKQSLYRMSSRLRKLCKRLAPSNEVVLEMQQIAADIRELAKIVCY